MGWIAREYPQTIKEITKNGYEIGSHSDMHQLGYTQNRQEFAEDLKRSIHTIEDLTAKKVRAYRAPGFSLTEKSKWLFEVLIDLGIEIDCSVFPASRAHGGFEKFKICEPTRLKFHNGHIKEFPMNLFSVFGRGIVFSGGGYFRVLPYSFINMAMKRSEYVMTYFHPRDFDAGQPMIKELSLLRRLKSYYGINGALEKLRKLLKEHPFVDLQTADSFIEWHNCDVITVN